MPDRSLRKQIHQGRELDTSRDTYADPAVKFIVDELVGKQLSYIRAMDKAGVAQNSLLHWRRGMSPSLCNIRAVLNALGYDFKIVRLSDAVD